MRPYPFCCRFAVAVLFALLPASSLGAQAATSVEELLTGSMGLSASDVSKAASGTPVIRLLAPAGPREIALFSVVSVNVAQKSVAADLANTQFWVASAKGRSTFGFFSDPATADDARAFFVTPEEAQIVRKCRPGSCDLKLPASSMAAARAAIDWSAPRPDLQASRLARSTFAEYVNEYRKKGAAAMAVYADTDIPGDLGRTTARLLRASPFLDTYANGLGTYMLRYPEVSLPGSRDRFFWSVDRIHGLRPISSLTHMTFYEVPSRSIAVLSEKQLYASHYFDAALTVTAAVARDSSRSWLMIMRRLEFDKLPSGGLLNVKGRVTDKLKAAMEEESRSRKAALER